MASTNPTKPSVIQINGGTILGRHQPASSSSSSSSSAGYGRDMDLFYDVPYGRYRAGGGGGGGRFRRAEACPPVLPGRTIRADVDRGYGQPQISEGLGAGAGTRCDGDGDGDEDEERGEGELRVHVFRACRCSSSPSSSSSLPLESSSSPSKSSSSHPLPVVIYIHGGGYNFGSPHRERDLAAWASWSKEPMVVFAVEYRLGVLGFGGTRGGVENVGLWDQRLALGWVGEWAASFGGLVGGGVTLMGFSAGAHSIGHHLLSPHPLPIPISKAILESGGPTARSVLSPTHERPTRQLASLRRHARDTELESMPLPDLLSAASAVWEEEEGSLTWPFQPVVDGEAGLIPDLPVRLLDNLNAGGETGGGGGEDRRIDVTNISLLTGFCTNEATSFISPKSDLATFFRKLIPKLNIQELQELYPIDNNNSNNDNDNNDTSSTTQRAYADYAYIAPVLQTASSFSRASRRRVRVYEYAADPSSHGDHILPVASRLHRGSRPGLVAVAEAMLSRWTDFVVGDDEDDDDDDDDDDDEKGKCKWPPFDIDSNPSILVFGAGNDEAKGGSRPGVPVSVRRLTTLEILRYRFWWRNVHLSQGMAC
ncbi:hypothetical protein CP532_2545 [Ophiocordyceps camponoti-leonardi (nom. inval.)]|nr:hypothetical protein CP532_2545 [Ophiocordyceps camponoti-leonardi (nom. inval.)]